MSEGLQKNHEREYDLTYEKREHRPGADLYIFDKVVVVVDVSGKNFKQLPELLFGTFDGSLDDADVLTKPQVRRDGVDMNYISACLHKVAEVTGIREFQFAAYGEDGHEQARLRLFKRFFLNIDESPDGHGYIVRL